MVVKAVEMVRKIRDKHYEETKDFSMEEQISFIKKVEYFSRILRFAGIRHIKTGTNLSGKRLEDANSKLFFNSNRTTLSEL